MALWRRYELLVPARMQKLHCPAHSLATVMTMLSQLPTSSSYMTNKRDGHSKVQHYAWLLYADKNFFYSTTEHTSFLSQRKGECLFWATI